YLVNKCVSRIHSTLFLYLIGNHRDRLSFPTRRSSDLATAEQRTRTRHRSRLRGTRRTRSTAGGALWGAARGSCRTPRLALWDGRSEEHTSELQSRENLVCRLLLERKNNNTILTYMYID